MDAEEGGAFFHLVAAANEELEADIVVDDLVSAGATCAEGDGAEAEFEGVNAGDPAGAFGGDVEGDGGPGEPVGFVDDPRIAVVGLDQRAHLGGGTPAGDAFPEELFSVGGVVSLAAEDEHLGAEGEGASHQVVGALAVEDLDGLAGLEGVADGEAEGGAHVGEEGDDLLPRAGADADEGLGELAGAVGVLHEGAAPDLDVEDEGVDALGQLLGQDAGDDEGDALDGGGDVAQGVDLLVSGGDLGRLTDHRDADIADGGDEGVGGEIDAEARDGLELVEGAAGVAEPATGHHGDRDPAGRHHGGQAEGDLVADPSGRVLVDLDPRDRGEVEHVAAPEHRVRELVGLGVAEPPQEGGHQPRRHLVVRQVAGDQGADQAANFAFLVLVTISLLGDQLDEACHLPSFSDIQILLYSSTNSQSAMMCFLSNRESRAAKRASQPALSPRISLASAPWETARRAEIRSRAVS